MTTFLSRFRFTCSLLALLGAGCATVGTRRHDAASDEAVREAAEEVSAGREIAAKLLAAKGASLTDLGAAEYVSLVGQALAQQSGRPEIRFHFAILDTADVAAYSAPGGYVFVTRGLLAAIHSESELAAVLAREIAHVNEKHLVTAGGADRALSMLLHDGMPIEQERAADEAACLYLTATGYNPAAMHAWLKFLEASRGGAKSSRLSERVRHLEGFLASNGLQDPMTADARVLDRRFEKALSALREDRAPSSLPRKGEE